MHLESFVREETKRLGFCAVGFAAAGPSRTYDRFRAWLARGYAADMAWLSKNAVLRAQPALLAPYVKTIIVAAARYPSAGPSEHWSACALGRDYHDVLRGKLKALAEAIRGQISGPLLSRVCVDSAPILEREWACRAGLGWIGRQGSLVHPDFGCCLFLGELLTNLELEASTPVPNQCGDCRLCVEACPTGAIQADGFVDARRCRAYLTIEHQGDFPAALRPLVGTTLFGCDRCTAVCPRNRQETGKPTPAPSKEGTGNDGNPPLPPAGGFAIADTHPAREIKITLPSLEGPGVGMSKEETGVMDELRGSDPPLPTPEDCLAMTEEDFACRFAGSAVLRLGLERLRRNAAAALENQKQR